MFFFHYKMTRRLVRVGNAAAGKSSGGRDHSHTKKKKEKKNHSREKVIIKNLNELKK